MKNVYKLLALLFLTVLSISCTPQALDDESNTNQNTTYATGDNDSSELDNEKDGE